MADIPNDEVVTDATVIGVATSVIVAGFVIIKARSCIPREPYVNRAQERENYINSILHSSEVHCIDQIRMSPFTFSELCDILTRKNLLQPTIHMSVKEQVIMFLHILGHNVRFRVIGSRFYRSIETVHRYFLIVLDAILKLYPEVIIQPDCSNPTPMEIRNSRRFYPWFGDCVGAIDGTHIRASVPVELQGRFRGRKGTTTQNVLAAVNFDLKFTYVLAGWEGSAHDSRILSDALTRPMGLQVPRGKYYLVDSGYGSRVGFIPPYRGVRYHLKEYSNRPPQNEKELFNLRHSSLRTTIERCFGILKKRFRVLDAEPYWKYPIQVDVVLACCVLHNYIIGVDPNDIIMQEATHESQTQSERVQQTQREERAENREWIMKRDAIAHAMFVDYRSRGNM